MILFIYLDMKNKEGDNWKKIKVKTTRPEIRNMTLELHFILVGYPNRVNRG